MWRVLKNVLPVAALAGTGYLSYNLITDYHYKTLIDQSENFIVYSPKGKHDLTPELSALNLPVFNTSQGFRPENLGLTLEKSNTGVNFVRKINGQFLVSSLDSKERLQKWVQFYRNPYLTINTREDLLNLLKNRKKFAFLDSYVLVYAPLNDKAREETLNQAIFSLFYKDSPSKYLASSTSGYMHLVRVTDSELAKELKIDSDLPVYLKISDPRGSLSTMKPRSQYQDPETLSKYIGEKYSKNFTVNGHELQLDNQIFFDRFEFGQEKNVPENKFDNIDELFDRLSSINPLIFPVFNTKHLMLAGPRLLTLSLQENSKILIVSLKRNKQEKTSSEILSILSALKLEKFAYDNPDVTVLIGYPEIIYHLPFRDLAIYHFEDVEVRLFTLNKGTVINSMALDERMSLDELMKSEEIRLESSPIKAKQYAEVLNIEKFNEKVLGNKDRCAFVMNCSKTCPACEYSDEYFQEAAGLSTKCKFYKYYVSNQNPKYKGPNSTPRFHLYKPGEKSPVVYEQKIHGLKPVAFLEFIDKQLE